MRAAHLQLPLRLRRQHIPQEKLGRLLRECDRHGSRRRQRGRLSRGRQPHRGVHGVGRMLAGVLLLAQGPRPVRCAHVHRRQGLGHDGRRRRGVSGCGLPEVHGALLPQRPGQAPESKRAKVTADLDAMRLKEAARCVHDGVAEALTRARFLMRH